MSILRTRLSDHITRGSRGGPTKPDRRVLRDGAGRIVKITYLTDVRPHRYDIGYGMKFKEDFEEVLACFHAVHASGAEGFLHKDWNDYEADESNSALELVSGSIYRLQRKYTFGAATCYRSISYPVEATLKVYSASDVLLAHTFSQDTNLVTITGTPSYWVGEFDVPVTFLEDLDTIELDGVDGDELLGLQSVKLEELV